MSAERLSPSLIASPVTPPMPSPMPSPAGEDAADIVRMRALHAAQRAACAREPWPTLAQRRARLRRLQAAIRGHRDALVAAIDADFGGRSAFESTFADVIGPVLAIRHALSHLRSWMRPQRHRTELVFATNLAYVCYQPKGVVGIVAPWNFPVYLSLGPLVAALAAGNRALLKLSEHTPRTTQALRALLAECFAEDEVAVIGGGVAAAQAFTALPFDHLVFTGSPAIAPQVLAAAAPSLTPVTLELGGKSPAIVAPGADLAAAAASIVHGKIFNAGQICVSPDYALVPRESLAAFVAAVRAAFAAAHPQVRDDRDYTAIVNPRQLARLQSLLEDARAHGATVTSCGETDADRRMPLQIVTDVGDSMRLAQEEIFGPILPVLGYDSLDDALQYVAARPRPLALYPYGFGARDLARVLRETHAGGVTVNDWGWHVFNHDLPFGGIGGSGTGSYHGEEGFRALSHAKPVFVRHRWFPVGLFRPPYGRFVQRLVVRWYLGRR